MKITLKHITVAELTNGFVDNADKGVIGYGGRLDVRPPYQREFVYNEKKRNAVIDTISKGFPLNIMYWAARSDGTFEVIDGQQRTISIGQYVNGDFSFHDRYFHNLTSDEKDRIMKYALTVYICEGTESEKLDWFRVINIAGEALTDQELLNAVYHGPWITDAKKWFSRPGCPAQQLYDDYLSGSSIRQDYLETAIKWISDDHIKSYMATHQHDTNAAELWQYVQNVFNWVKVLFPTYRREMKGLGWGFLYNDYHNASFNSVDLEQKITELMQDEDVTKKKGIYLYLITGEEKQLSIRAFTLRQKREAYERQQGLCAACGDHFELREMEADHITPWSEGGRTISSNCQMLCKACNRKKSNK